MDYSPKFTKEELILVKRALIEFMCLNEDGQDAFEYPIDREIARSLHVRLTMAYNLEGTGIEDD